MAPRHGSQAQPLPKDIIVSLSEPLVQLESLVCR